MLLKIVWLLLLARFGWGFVVEDCFIIPVGEAPLVLTELIRNGSIEAAVSASYVNHSAFQSVTSYSGFFEVNPEFESQMFFWYVKADENAEDAPVILWLQGGPGNSGLRGAFFENGPFEIVDEQIRKRAYSWHEDYNILYVDSPVGAGFSSTKNGYAQNMTAVANDLYEALDQFFKLFPGLKSNQFYIAGESYAGKYIPAIGRKIHEENQGGLKINLQGFIIGNGFVDPVNQLKFGNILHQFGYLDKHGLNDFINRENEIVDLIENENWTAAYKAADDLILGSYEHKTLFNQLTGHNNFHTLFQENYKDDTYIAIKEMFFDKSIRLAFHVGSERFKDDVKVRENLIEDFGKSMASELADLLSNYRVLMYYGIFNSFPSFRTSSEFIRNMNFPGSETFKTTEKSILSFDDELMGYYKKTDDFSVVLLRNAGHHAIEDQPKWVKKIVDLFIENL